VRRDDERLSRVSSRLPHLPDRRTGASWLVARSAGEVLLLAAGVTGVVALIVALDDGETASPLEKGAATLFDVLESYASVVVAVTILVGLILTWALAMSVRARADASARADRLAHDLARMRSQAERLREILAGRDDLLLAVVHELRVPLTHVVGYAELLSGGARPRHPKEVGEMSAAIQSASTTMLRLMDDLVETTRAQAVGFSLKPRPVDLVHLIRGVVAGYEAQFQAQDQLASHRFVLDLPDHWLAVSADPERIHQVLANLLSNAISYSPSGGEIRVSARQIGGRVRVEIADEGIGMDAEDQRLAFDRFYRASRGRAVREEGSGLGLAIVRELVEAHGGELGVSSQAGVGSTFWFTLQVADERVSGAQVGLTAQSRP
jgi:signal transduction histidine kinase